MGTGPLLVCRASSDTSLPCLSSFIRVHFEGVIPDLFQNKETENQAGTLQGFSYLASAWGFSWLNLVSAGVCQVTSQAGAAESLGRIRVGSGWAVVPVGAAGSWPGLRAGQGGFAGDLAVPLPGSRRVTRGLWGAAVALLLLLSADLTR